ncbi:Phenylalanine--tRNA ligase beta subunit [Aquicella siphonis]|uniref:Phenylalanine--tRNA ligase beta subunit n=1 Tax=Aquicella siphonis TaxID=254247 RepID=A0A5E4PHQ9_9COXI|nr:phenylalanine--tRNA ligase subunit beta [Aquicella siphonis]VVC76068.1 Phenylalanine--tRNA ligase beta subunit [Aquicella siphonis]
MKCSESWLREWVDPGLTHEQLCSTLTMAGLEVEEIVPVANHFSGVIVGQVLTTERHPEAERLHVCTVNIGEPAILEIVCGAENVRAGIKVPVAAVNAVLPNGTVISQAVIRGVTSQGMLCSASELGLSETSQGLLELPEDAPIGADLKTYLMLDDHIIDISITPNRGDCLSVRGIAREISALTRVPLLKNNPTPEVESVFNIIHSVAVEAESACPVYIGRVIRNIKADALTPVWMKERLRRSGIRAISPVVDATNYVMLELGQPMHAFDLNRVRQGIRVRLSRTGETITLLDGSEKHLDAQTLIIADDEKPLAIAGVMGGADSGVNLLTTDIFLESAYFDPQVIARQRQYYGLTSESAYRFERGVDPTIQRQAMEWATQLIIDITGGEVGPVIELVNKSALPDQRLLTLPVEKIEKVLGVAIPGQEVENIFEALKFKYKRENTQWRVLVPPYRFDITLPEDLIEEIARLHGYDKIPAHTLAAELQSGNTSTGARDWRPLRQLLSDRGYHEVITYSFIDSKLQKLLDPEETPCELVNPITSDMTVMRTSLLPGLVNTLLYNHSRQQNRVRLFELGTCFNRRGKNILQQSRLGGIIMGHVCPEQWGIPAREADFYDLKGDLECLFHTLPANKPLTFKPVNHPGMHPGQTAGIFYDGQQWGVAGALHPTVSQSLDLPGKVFVYELDIRLLEMTGLNRFQEVSKFPEIRRDLAILVNQAIPASEIQDTIKVIAGDWLKDVFIFDVYQGKGISPGLKSIALALILQHPTRTLVDDEVTALVERVVTTLNGKLGAELRR